ncbi:uncharacterized protein EI90DRAFT_3035746 [Cantharellus anzutake]|uniref:uncharacterized protein n=1 Tax=Cantharellus anzutake TaxID=1750568 RepID=UPI001906E8FE|nr:uncharacterized protein EI90DRAFT_3035746 [Cantharellus anzutake]KAF8340487.1 hypothetical protein EI90DRAFT_3035746 [Cantharellus anzutake]
MPVAATADGRVSRLPRSSPGSPSTITRSGIPPVDSTLKAGASKTPSTLRPKFSSSTLGRAYVAIPPVELPRSPQSGSSLLTTRAPTAAIRTQKSTGSLRSATSTARSPASPTPTSRFAAPTPIKRAANISRTNTPIHKAPSTGNFKSSTSTCPDGTEEEVPAPPKSIKELLALKRAEVKRARELKSKESQASLAQLDDVFGTNEEHWEKPAVTMEDAEDELLGRPTIRQAIEKARSNGHLNLSSRQLKVIPRILYTMHLGVEPKRLAAENEQPQSPTKEASEVSWYEAQDLTILKAADNEIQEIQEEIGLFGGLKTIDFHKNPLSALPIEFSDLGALTHLDLSSCQFETIPPMLAHIPSLTNLNLSNNIIASVTLGLTPLPARRSSDPFFRPSSPSRQPATPFPVLQILQLQGNKLTGPLINSALPKSLIKLDVSQNPIGDECEPLFASLAALPCLKELRMRECKISDAGLPKEASVSTRTFPSLEAMDLGMNETITEAAVRAKLFGDRELHIVQDIDMTATHEAPKRADSLIPIRIAVGKIIRREAWEIEAEKRAILRRKGGRPVELETVDNEDDPFGFGTGFGTRGTPAKRVSTPIQEPKDASAPSSPAAPTLTPAPVPRPPVKAQWELDAEAGLNTAAGRRRAEAKLVANEVEKVSPHSSSDSVPSLDKYYTAARGTLSLPPALPTPKGRLGNSRSRVFHSLSQLDGGGNSDPIVPLQTMPLPLILSQPWSAALRVLELSNRRADVCIVQPLLDAQVNNILPGLEELKLDGCNLGDTVRIREGSSPLLSASTSSPEKSGVTSTESTIRALIRLFPKLKVLDLSFNNLTTLDGVEEIFIPSLASTEASGVAGSNDDGGLKVLRARSNQIDDGGLAPLVLLGQKFRQGQIAGEQWEVDIRENSIAKVLYRSIPIVFFQPITRWLCEKGLPSSGHR